MTDRPTDHVLMRESEARESTAVLAYSERSVAAPFIALLLGAGTSIAVSGLIAGFQAEAGPPGSPAGAVICVSLICLAMGIRVPQRFTVWLCALVWRRFVARSRASEMSIALIDADGVDSSLCWAVQAIVALTAGLATAALPFTLRGAGAFEVWMRSRFVWSDVTMALSEGMRPFVAAVVPLTVIGLAVSFAHRISGARGQWDTRATGWLSIGAALGLIALDAVGPILGRSDPTMVAASLPMFVASVIAAVAGSNRKDQKLPQADSPKNSLPSWSDRWPLLLRTSIIGVGAGGACVMLVWTSYLVDYRLGYGTVLSSMFAALGVGVLLGCRRKSSGLRSIGGFGVACAASGLITAVGTYGFRGTSTPHWACAIVAACTGIGAIGFATAYGRQTLLHRVASRPAAGATILTALLIACAVTLGVVAPVSIHFLGHAPTLMMLGLSLLALGGTLIIHEPTYSQRTRRLRLCAVFASLGVLITTVILSPPVAAGKGATLGRPGAQRPVYQGGDAPVHSVGETNDR